MTDSFCMLDVRRRLKAGCVASLFGIANAIPTVRASEDRVQVPVGNIDELLMTNRVGYNRVGVRRGKHPER